MAGLPAILNRLMPWRARAAEGQYRPGPYWLDQGWLPADWGKWTNWWQNGHRLLPYGERRAMVEACVSAYAQTVAMCPGDHWRKLRNGGRERVAGSALTRIIKQPNDYQSVSDFLLNLTRRLYERGEAFAVAERNARNEIIELHPMREGRAMVAQDSSVFYALWGNEVVATRTDLLESPVPARDVLHVRLHTPVHILRGVSPILSANLDLLVSEAAMTQQALFFKNMARPSFVIESNDKTTEEQVKALRAWWDEWSQGEGVGKSPILGWGFRARQMQSSAVDAQLAELLKMTDQNIALTMRVPLQVLGIGGAPFASTELLMQFWYANGLGFCLNHIEEAFGNLFGLRGQPDEYLEFNTKALLRSAWREMIEGLGRATISGIMSPDEARDEIDLPEVPGGVGAMPRVQQQVVPLSYGADLQPPKPGASTPAAPAPPDNQPPPAQGDGSDAAGAGQASVADLTALLRSSHERHSLAA